ncbi:hypothetical protein EYF80_013331 [Liparis tanakae]|uniref:Uncharacterized protein n=1 Tax=Liparis tanakae TaxID=230148 RepID=A0A4Z2IEU6_9TELE|nr:hypothetical protein EYF80_013331 [Liparis tanakae]
MCPGSSWGVQCFAQGHFDLQLMGRAGIEPTTLGLQDDPLTPLSYSRPDLVVKSPPVVPVGEKWEDKNGGGREGRMEGCRSRDEEGVNGPSPPRPLLTLTDRSAAKLIGDQANGGAAASSAFVSFFPVAVTTRRMVANLRLILVVVSSSDGYRLPSARSRQLGEELAWRPVPELAPRSPSRTAWWCVHCSPAVHRHSVAVFPGGHRSLMRHGDSSSRAIWHPAERSPQIHQAHRPEGLRSMPGVYKRSLLKLGPEPKSPVVPTSHAAPPAFVAPPLWPLCSNHKSDPFMTTATFPQHNVND